MTTTQIDRDATPYRGLDPHTLATMLGEKQREISRLSRLSDNQPHGPEFWALQRQYRTAIAQERAMQQAAAIDFGASRGWSLSQKQFDLIALAEGKQHQGARPLDMSLSMLHQCFDHPYFYRRNRKAAAIVAHLYGWPKVRPECEKAAAMYGLTLNVPDLPSWWYDGTTIVAYIGPAGQ